MSYNWWQAREPLIASILTEIWSDTLAVVENHTSSLTRYWVSEPGEMASNHGYR